MNGCLFFDRPIFFNNMLHLVSCQQTAIIIPSIDIQHAYI